MSRIGVRGEILETPGHSDDSISLVLDSGRAFTGDLQLPDRVQDEGRRLTCQSWEKLLSLNVHTIYPGHGDPFQAEEVKKALGIGNF